MHGRSNESSLLNSKIVFSSASEARLYSKDASGKERYAVISTPVFTMGRGHENDFSSGAPNVSRQHALIQVADGRTATAGMAPI